LAAALGCSEPRPAGGVQRLFEGAVWRRGPAALDLPAACPEDQVGARDLELPAEVDWVVAGGAGRRARWIEPGRPLRCAAPLPLEAPRLRLSLTRSAPGPAQGEVAPDRAGTGLRVEAALEGGPARVLFEEAEGLETDGGWRDLELELPDAWVGATVEFGFEAFGGQGRIALGEPRLVGAPGPLPQDPRPRRRADNIVLICIDGLRADRLGAYGQRRQATPAFDRLSARSWRFERCWAPGPDPAGSRASLLLGRWVEPGAPPAESLPIWLARQGFETAVFSSTAAAFAWGDGFDLVADWPEGGVARGAIEWIERCGDQPFFLCLHAAGLARLEAGAARSDAADVAAASAEDAEIAAQLDRAEAPGRLSPAARQRADERYDALLRGLDAELGALLSALESHGLFESSVLALTAAVGFELGERGRLGPALSLHEEQLHVPLFLCLPGRGAGRSELLASGLDLAPTLISAAGLTPPAGLAGRDLFAGRSQAPRLPPGAAGQSLFAWWPGPWPAAASLRGRHKVLLLPGEASAAEGKRPAALDFDLTLDPGELDPRPLAPGRLEELEAFLARRAQDPVAAPPKVQSDRRSVGSEAMDWLAALGWFVD
jgi:arylsulfatase A-like enzyme